MVRARAPSKVGEVQLYWRRVDDRTASFDRRLRSGGVARRHCFGGLLYGLPQQVLTALRHDDLIDLALLPDFGVTA